MKNQARLKTIAPIAATLLALAACSSGGNSGSDAGSGSVDNGQVPDDGSAVDVLNNDEPDSAGTPGTVPQSSLPEGNIVQFGAINIADDEGVASDLVGGFFQLDAGVDASYFESLLDPDNINCVVDSDDSIDFEEISASYIPGLTGVGKQSISAGEVVLLSSATGTYAEITRQPAGGFIFYELPNGQSVPDGNVPDTITVDIPGDRFAAFENVTAGTVSPLSGFTISTGDSIDTSTVFRWDEGRDDNSQIRIFTSTAGGFFLEDGKTVTCIVPDTGEFRFPADVRNELGSDFNGALPLVSRITTRSQTQDNSVLFMIRESFI